MSKTVQELLAPRYKVIADYPGCSFEVGTILQPNEEGELFSETGGYSWSITRIMEKEVNKFKHLVKKLEWWEDRQPDEMPEYVRCIRTPDQQIMPGQVMKMKWDNVLGRDENDRAVIVDTNCYQPATKEEYDQYISSGK